MSKIPWVGTILLTTALLAFAAPVTAQTSSPAVVDLAITRTVDDTSPFPGDTIRYTVNVSNEGRRSATNVQVDHLLPRGVTYVASSPSRGIYVPRTGVWAVDELASGETASLTITVLVDGNARGSTLTDSARLVSFDQVDGNPDNDSDGASIRVRSQERTVAELDAVDPSAQLRAGDADLGLVKTVDTASPAENGTIVYTIALSNSGPDAATNIQINDLLPSGVTYSSNSVTQGIYIAGSGIWVLSSLANGAADTLAITATVDSGTAGTTITNTASVGALDETDGNSANDSDSADITVQGAELALVKTVSDANPNEGDQIDYTVVLTNNGPDAATNVQVTDLLPSGVTLVSSSTTQGSYIGGSGVWSVGTVANASADTLTITVSVNAGTGTDTIVNSASITASDQADGNSSNNSDSASLTVQSVDMSLAKTVDDANPNEGDTVAYTLVLANGGPDAATNVEVTDVLPTGMTFVSSSATSGTYSSGTGVWSVASLAASGSDTLTINASVDAGTGTSTIVNSASITDSDQADGNAANDSDSASLTVQSVDLAVTKTVDDAAPSEGGTIVYTIAVANGGPDEASNVEITDVLPTGVTFVSSSATAGSYVSGTGVWSLASLAAAGSDTLTITATVDSGTGGTSIDNTATLTGSDQADSNPANDTDTAGISVLGADLAVTKTVSNDNPNEGGSVQYTVVVTNNGPDATTNVAVSDVLPTGMTFVSSSATAGSYTSGTGVWSVPSLAASGSATLTLTASVDAGTGGTTIVNTATATGSDLPDNTPGNDSDSAGLTVQSVDLAVSKTIDDPTPNEGGTVQYTVAVTNAGPDDATSVQLTDILPAGVTFVSGAATQGTYVAGTGIWNVGDVALGAADTLVITATVDAGTNGSTIVNTASLSASDQADANATNDSDSASFTVQSIDLALTKVVSNLVPNEGDPLTYTIVLLNSGPDAATSVQVTDQLPAGLTFVSSTPSQGTYSSGTGIWNVGTVANSGSATLNLVATVDAGTNGSTISNTAAVTASDQTDSSPGDNSDSVDVTVQSVDLVVTKTVDDPAPNEGGTIVYTVVVDNAGPDAATDVQITDLLPSGVTYVSASATQGFYVSGSGSWVLANVPNAGSDTLTITATVDAGTGGSTISNTASVTASDQADSNPANDSDSADVNVQGVDLAITKTVDNALPNEGATVVYTVVLDNAGPDTATNVEVTDVLPAGVSFVSGSATSGSYSSGTGVWSVASLAAAGSDTLTLTATVDAGTGGDTIVNTAAVTAADQADGTPGNDSDSASLTVQSVDLAVTKTVDDGNPNEGDTIVYTVVLANDAGDTATGVELTDLLPTGVTYVSSTTTQGTYVPGTGVWTVGSVPTASPQTLTITATVNAGTNGSTIVNTASVTAVDQGDAIPGNDSDTADIVVQSVDLAVVKTVDNPSPNEGATINYTVALANGGPDAATNVVVTDLLPVGVTFASATATTGSYVSGTGVWTVGTIPAAGADTLVITATVDAGTNGSTIVNAASVTAVDQADSNAGNNSDSASLTVQGVDLAVTKSIDVATPNEGDTVNYTVSVSNAGPNTATNVQITDVLPAGVTFVSSSATQGTYGSGTGIWGVGSVSNGGSATLTITATVDAGTNGTTIGNTASVTAVDQADSNSANDSDSVDLTVQSVDLSITKVVDDPAPSEGGTINYTIALANAGPDAATNVTVTDLLPAGVTFVSSSATQGTYVSGTGVWSVPSVAAAGADTLVLTATIDVATGGTSIDNTASVTGSDQADSNPANDSDSAGLAVQAADLAVVKTVDDANPNEGGTIAYTVVVTNNGPDATTNVEVTDVLPAGLTFVSSAATSGAYVSGTGVWSLASLAGFDSDSLTITATVDAGTGATTIVNTASVTASDQPDNNPANDSDSAGLTVQGVDLAVVKTVNDAFPNEGGSIDYQIVLSNAGPDAATNVEVTDVLPAGVTFVAAGATAGSYDDGTGVWSVPSVANGGSATLTLTASVDVGTNGTTIVNSASVTASDQADGNAANDSDSVSLTVQSVDLAVTKSVDDPTPNEGGLIDYEIVVTNAGPDAATTVRITDSLPTGVTFVSSSATQGSYVSGTGLWSLASLAAGAADTLTITATVDAGTNGSTIVNIASLTSTDQADSNPANDSDTADITVQSADLAITKTVNDAAPSEGDTIAYTIQLDNLGPDAATNVQVTDLLPAGVTFVSSSATQGFYVSGTGIWVVASIAGPGTETLTINASVDVGTGGTAIVNSAAVTASDQADGNAANDSDSVQIDVQGADLALTKTIDDPSPAEGGTINYTIGLTNNGPDGTTNVEVTDLLPAGVTFVSSSATVGSYVSGTGVWSVPSLANAGTATLTLTATVDAGTGGTTIVNSASVTASDQPDNNPADDSDSASFTAQGADLAVVKTVDVPNAPEGGSVQWQVVLTNNGPDTATSIQVNDALPAGVTYVSADPGAGIYISSTGVWILASLANGASDTLTITTSVDAGTDGQTIVNTASVAVLDQPDGNAANDSDTASFLVQGGADLAVTKTVDDPNPAEGGTIVYTIALANAGPDGGTNLEVTDLLPTGVTFVSSTATAGTYVDSTGVWSVASLAAAASDTLEITATVDAGTSGSTITNTASVTASDQSDGNAANDSDSADIDVLGSADLAVVKTVDDPAPLEGATIVYTVALSNGGPDAATNVEVTDLLPTGVTFVSSAPTAGTYVDSTGVWSVASLAAAASDTLEITATVDLGTGGTTIVNTASVTASDQVDGNAADDSDTADIDVPGGADLAVTKTVDDATPAEGGTIVYAIALENLGPDGTTNVEVTDVLPGGVTFVSSASTSGSYDDGTGVWSVASLAAAASDTLEITATVDAGTGGTNIVNTATITASDSPDGTPGNDSDTAAIDVVAGADLAITKTVDDPLPTEGAGIAYTVVVDNLGPDPTTNVEVTDLLPTGVTFQSASASQGSYVDGTGVWTVGGLASAGSATLTINVSVDAGAGGSTIVNTASVTATDAPDYVSANDSDSASITVLTPGGETQVTTVGSDARPTWSPDGQFLGFDSVRSGNRDIWTIPATGGTATQITTGTGIDQHPDWSPDSTQFVIIGDAGASWDLYLVSSSGGTPVLLDGDVDTDRFPVFSPDGTQIAYDKLGDIYVIPTTGGTPLQITTDPNTDLHPTWSPDGTQIAFISNRAGSNDIWTIPATGGTATQITSGSPNDGAPDWSPDGSRIAYQSNTAGNNDIWVVPATGGTPEQITTATGNDAQPDWSPAGDAIAFARINVGLFIYTLPTFGNDVAVTKSVDLGFPNEGGSITYTVGVTNNGSTPSTGLQLTDLLPAGVTFVSSTETTGTYTSGTGLWDIGTLGSGASATLTITATVDAGTGGTTITNTVAITAVDQGDPIGANDTASVDITVQSADLAVTKSVSNPAPAESDIIAYRIILTNNGPFTAIGVEVTDLLPAGVTFVSATTTQGVYADSSGVWTLGNMVSASADTLDIDASVDVGTFGQTIVNTASVTASAQADPDPGNDSASAEIVVGSGVDAPSFGFVPTSYALGLARPNPSRGTTTIPFDIPTTGMAKLTIWDVRGRLVKSLVQSELTPGRYQPSWDGRDDAGRRVAAGIYFVRLESGNFSAAGKVIRLR